MKKLLEWKPVRFGLEVGELYFSKRVSRSAAELAYFLILTFFPVLICINAFIGLLHLDINAVLEAASPFLPRETLGILGDYIQYITGNQSPALLAAGGIMTLFSASAAFRALMNIMEDLYGRKSYAGVWRIAASVAFSVLFLLTIYLALVVLLTGGWLFHLVERLFRLETVTLPWDWQWFRFLLLFLLVFLFVLLVYRMAAPRGRPRPPILTGAFLAAVALVAATALFSWFIGLSSRYSLAMVPISAAVPAGVPFCPAGVPDGRAPRQAKAAYPYRGLSGRRGPCGRHRPVFLVYRPVFQVLPGLRVPGLGDYPAGVALPVWEHPDSGKCL